MRPELSRHMKRFCSTLALALLGVSLGSCSPAAPLAMGPASGVKTTTNTNYRTPPVKGAVPRNPDAPFSNQFGQGAGVTFTRVPVAGPYIAITFDDGPHATFTPRLLDMLRERNIKATFFVCGNNCELYPNILRRIVAEGHELGNHSYNHPVLAKMSEEQVRSQLSRTHQAVLNATGVNMRLLRPPYGAFTPAQREWALREFGYPTILWSVDPLDWKKPGSSVITSRITSQTTQGDIILAHDIHGQTIDAMPATLDALLRKGYRFVTVSQLIAMKTQAAPQNPAAAPAAPGAPAQAATAP